MLPMRKDAAAYPFDLGRRRFMATVPCWIGQAELLALGHGVALARGERAEHGSEALRQACTVFQPEITPEMIDRGDWQEVLEQARRAQFDLEGAAEIYLGDYGWALPAEAVGLASRVLEAQIEEVYRAVHGELELADLVSQRLEDGPAADDPALEWAEVGESAPEPDSAVGGVAAMARALSERMNALAAGLDPGPAPEALRVLEQQARSEVGRLFEALKEELAPVRCADDLCRLLRPLRAMLADAQRMGVGLYLALT
jgi:hypothetical protein